MNDDREKKSDKTENYGSKNGKIRNPKPTIEAIELMIQNAERLLDDSKHVSTPTKFALLEIGLEEVSKAWGIILTFDIISVDKNPNFFEALLKVGYVDTEKISDILDDILPKIIEFFSKYNPDSFMMPFDSKRWKDHKAKISYLSQLIEYINKIALPITRASSDRTKAIGDILGKHISIKRDLKEIDAEIDNILNVNYEHLTEIVRLKESGLYVDISNDVFIAPSSIPFETETLENLLDLLIGMIKGEVKSLLITLKTVNSHKATMNNNGQQEKKVKIE
jgi:hypothetical protein